MMATQTIVGLIMGKWLTLVATWLTITGLFPIIHIFLWNMTVTLTLNVPHLFAQSSTFSNTYTRGMIVLSLNLILTKSSPIWKDATLLLWKLPGEFSTLKYTISFQVFFGSKFISPVSIWSHLTQMRTLRPSYTDQCTKKLPSLSFS